MSNAEELIASRPRMAPVFYFSETDDLIRGEVVLWGPAEVVVDLPIKDKRTIGHLKKRLERSWIEPYMILPGLWRPCTIETLDRGRYAYVGFQQPWEDTEANKIWRSMLIDRGRSIVFDRAGRRLERELKRTPTEEEIKNFLRKESAVFWMDRPEKEDRKLN